MTVKAENAAERAAAFIEANSEWLCGGLIAAMLLGVLGFLSAASPARDRSPAFAF